MVCVSIKPLVATKAKQVDNKMSLWLVTVFVSIEGLTAVKAINHSSVRFQQIILQCKNCQ